MELTEPRPRRAEPLFMDLTGQRFDHWEVVERAESSARGARWRVRCDCGTVRVIRGDHLRAGKTRSCGCLSVQVLVERNRARMVEVPGYNTAHERLRRVRGKANDHPCASCGGGATDWAYTHDDPKQLVDQALGLRYSPDPQFYVPMCRSCHSKFDRRDDPAWEA